MVSGKVNGREPPFKAGEQSQFLASQQALETCQDTRKCKVNI